MPASSPRLTLPKLPVGESIVFKDSRFFTWHNALPSPSEVRMAANPRNLPGHLQDPNKASIVHFPSLQLTVKYSRYTTIAEGQCLWAIRQVLHDAVPVPEVYGWCLDGKSTFIYMQLVEGSTLEERWETLSTDERVDICGQLSHMVKAMRCLEQCPMDQFVGHIGHQPLQDIIFISSCSPPAGPFPNISSFHDYFVNPRNPDNATFGNPPHPMRSKLPDDVAIKFTHGDLHRSNILLSPNGTPPRVVAIIDWHQSGWLPEYWEFCKARWTAWAGEEWEQEYLPRFLESHDVYDIWDYFVLKLGL